MATALVKKAETIRDLLMKDSVKKQLALAIPKHLSVERLLRVAYTSILRNPKLMECTPQSLLSCIMVCGQLGLEPDQFLGQAYLVPFKNHGTLECTLIPGYRGYIALARRSGEVQSVSAQVVYTKDHFELTYGIDEKLNHIPADGDRGEVRGAYVVFRYKDGSHSFDYMPKADIDRIRARSKSANDGPWVTDYAEMAKKTVIKRHAKLAPMSVEFAKAVALDDRAELGEPQADLLIDDAAEPVGMIEETKTEVVKFSVPEDLAGEYASINEFMAATARANRSTLDQVKESVCSSKKNTESFWSAFRKWKALSQPKAEEKSEPPTADEHAEADRKLVEEDQRRENSRNVGAEDKG